MDLALYPITKVSLPPDICREQTEEGATFAVFIRRDNERADTDILFIKPEDYEMRGSTLVLPESLGLKTSDTLLLGKSGTSSSWLYRCEDGWSDKYTPGVVY